MQDDVRDWQRLERYFAGECDPREAAEVRRWLEAHPARRDIAAALALALARTDAIASGDAPSPTWDIDSAWTAMRRASTASPRARGARPWPRGIGQSAGRAWHTSIALTAAVVVAAGTAVVWRLASIASSQPAREFATPAGARAMLTLRDGTRLTLGPASRLRVPPDFGSATRSVDLNGEALFAVRHDARHPFVVRTAHVQVRDVGTIFGVRAYTDDATERVAVAEGAVTVGDGTVRGISLAARDVAVVDSLKRIELYHAVDLSPDLAWAQGRLVFRDTPLREVARDLGRAFDLTINIADSTLAARPVTAAFGDDPVDEVLDAITRAVGASYQQTGRHVLIKSLGGAAERPMPGERAPLTTAEVLQRE